MRWHCLLINQDLIIRDEIIEDIFNEVLKDEISISVLMRILSYSRRDIPMWPVGPDLGNGRDD